AEIPPVRHVGTARMHPSALVPVTTFFLNPDCATEVSTISQISTVTPPAEAMVKPTTGATAALDVTTARRHIGLDENRRNLRAAQFGGRRFTSLAKRYPIGIESSIAPTTPCTM